LSASAASDGVSATTVSIDGLTMAYRGLIRPVVDGISLTVAPGNITAVLGPSGCGKTTSLKLVAGLLSPDAGDIRFDDESVLGLAAETRSVAMVFQKPLLFPHMTVGQNVGFGLRVRRLAKREARAEIDRMLDLVQLPGLVDRPVSELSGGMEQRVALARALVVHPKVLLLDEPLSQLDAALRVEMRELILEVQRSVGVTTLFVTHDQDEAVSVADRIALMFDGRIEQHDVPRAFYERPASARTARFFGARNLVAGRVEDGVFVAPIGRLDVAGAPPSGPGVLVVRPEALRLADSAGPNVVSGRVAQARFRGDHVTVDIDVAATTLEVTLPPSVGVGAGAHVNLLVPPEACWVVPAEVDSET